MPRRAEIWLADLDKRRPVVVLTRDPMGDYLKSLLVVPVSTRSRGLDVEVMLDQGDGLKRRSFANLDAAERVEVAAMRLLVGLVRDEKMDEICRALSLSVGCD